MRAVIRGRPFLARSFENTHGPGAYAAVNWARAVYERVREFGVLLSACGAERVGSRDQRSGNGNPADAATYPLLGVKMKVEPSPDADVTRPSHPVAAIGPKGYDVYRDAVTH